MSKDKMVYAAALGLITLVSIGLALANVTAGDGNGGLGHIIRALL